MHMLPGHLFLSATKEKNDRSDAEQSQSRRHNETFVNALRKPAAGVCPIVGHGKLRAYASTSLSLAWGHEVVCLSPHNGITEPRRKAPVLAILTMFAIVSADLVCAAPASHRRRQTNRHMGCNQFADGDGCQFVCTHLVRDTHNSPLQS
jgi:hypothetical protein